MADKNPPSDLGVTVVGDAPSLRQDVAGVLGVPVEAITLIPNVPAAKEALRRKPANVVVISSKVDESEGLSLARFIAVSSPTTAVVAVRDRELGGLLQMWMRAGVRDVVDEWMGDSELRETLNRAVAWSSNLRAQLRHEPVGPVARGAKLVSVFSSKGGSGKTFLACNLALAIAQKSQADTALVDLDLTMGDVFSYFGNEPNRSLQDLISLGEGAEASAIRDAGVKFQERLWAFGAPPDPAAEIIPAEEVDRFLRALQSNFDYVVVDTPAVYSDQVLTAFDAASSILVMASLDVVGIKHLAKALETLLSIGIQRDRIQIVLNRADSKVGLSPADVERVLKVSIDAMIPSSHLVPTSLNKGTPVYIGEPRSEVSASIGALAEKIIGTGVVSAPEAAEKKTKRRFLARVREA